MVMFLLEYLIALSNSARPCLYYLLIHQKETDFFDGGGEGIFV